MWSELKAPRPRSSKSGLGVSSELEVTLDFATISLLSKALQPVKGPCSVAFPSRLAYCRPRIVEPLLALLPLTRSASHSSMVQDAKITTLASGKHLFIDVIEGPAADAPTVFCQFK
jgi:hypothetical protein